MIWSDALAPRMRGLISQLFANRFVHRVVYKSACAIVLPLCALGAAGHLATTSAAAPQGHTTGTPTTASTEWPREWQGRPLRPLVLSDVEQRFARRFPGEMARLTDDRHIVVLRRVTQPTRMLHPAADCYRALGYAVADIQLEQASDHLLWRCFVASRAGQKLRVCERIEDAKGQGWTDSSSWYWAAALGQSQGPWQAVTVARPL
jgi:hypothetical protein